MEDREGGGLPGSVMEGTKVCCLWRAGETFCYSRSRTQEILLPRDFGEKEASDNMECLEVTNTNRGPKYETVA